MHPRQRAWQVGGLLAPQPYVVSLAGAGEGLRKENGSEGRTLHNIPRALELVHDLLVERGANRATLNLGLGQGERVDRQARGVGRDEEEPVNLAPALIARYVRV
jgi:hypothetical protein